MMRSFLNGKARKKKENLTFMKLELRKFMVELQEITMSSKFYLKEGFFSKIKNSSLFNL